MAVNYACPKCGESVANEEKYCSECGYELQSAEDTTGSSQMEDSADNIRCPRCDRRLDDERRCPEHDRIPTPRQVIAGSVAIHIMVVALLLVFVFPLGLVALISAPFSLVIVTKLVIRDWSAPKRGKE